MQYMSNVLRSILILTLFSCIVSGVTGSEKPASSEQTLEAIHNCMARSPGPWPDEWRQEYIENIRQTILSHQDTSQHNVKLEILRKGFAPYWEGFKKTQEKPLFEVHRAQIHWYIEHLMATEFPSEDERKKLRNQYKDLWDHAADSLLKQFPFLDPNAVQAAKAKLTDEQLQALDASQAPDIAFHKALEELGCSKGAYKKRLKRARKRLREFLAPFLTDEEGRKKG